MSEPGPTERRLAARHDVEIDVDLHTKRERIPLRALDVSRHGLFVQTKDPAPVGHAVLLTVRLRGGPFEAMATVARRETDLRHGPMGMGLKLFCLGADAKARWDGFVASLESPGVALPTRTSARGACFLVQPDDPQDLLLFFLKNVVGASTFHCAPAVRTIGAPVSVVLVHPKTHAEWALPARVVEWSADHPLRMGIRFDPVDREGRGAFKEFLGDVAGAAALSGTPPAPAAPLVAQQRPRWTEYALYSPKLRVQPPEEVLLLEEEALDVIEGELLDLEELELIDKRELFDFSWSNDDD